MIPRKFKGVCIACNSSGRSMNKEHFWPKWLIQWTGTHRTSVRFDTKKFVNPRAMTLPICEDCNSAFGRELESPVSRIFQGCELGEGLSDIEAELVVRWLWKMEGLAWRSQNPEELYSGRYDTIRDRVLRPIDRIRPHLILAVALAEGINPAYGDAPMGLDSWNLQNAIHVAGVFSRVAVMVVLDELVGGIPPCFGQYRLKEHGAGDRDGKLFFPPVGFRDCEEAVYKTRAASAELSYAHELYMRNLNLGGIRPSWATV